MYKLLFAAMPLFAPALLAQGTAEIESNDSSATATALALGAQGDGAIGIAGDVDFWAVALTGASDLRFWINPGVGVPMEDSDLALFAPDGTTLLASNDDVSGVTNWLSRIVAGNLPAGTYYLRARSSAIYLPLGTGTYTIDVIAAAPGTYVPLSPPLVPVTEAVENNDPRPTFGSGTATTSAVFSHNFGYTIAGGSSGTSATIVGKDYDFFEFTVTTTGVHTFSTLGTPGATAPVVDDTVIRLFDSAFTSLAYNDDYSGAYSFLTFNITAPGTYYMCVSGYYGTSDGNYVLDILGPLPPAPTGAASVTIQAGGCGGTMLATRLTNVLTPPIRTELPVLGSTFYLDGTGMEPNALAFRVVGFGVLGIPIDLFAFGGPAGCMVEVDPLGTTFILADGNGNDFWPMGTPADVGFIGLPFEQQLVALHSTMVVVASNRVSSVCGITN